MNIHIEYLADHPEFVHQIATWYFNQWGHEEPGVSVEKIYERVNSKLNRDQAPITIVALAAGHGKPVGAAQLKIREMDIYPDREFWLGGVYVDSAARGQGVAGLLVKKVEEISKQLGIQELYLQTERLSGGLYARLGWMAVEQVDYQGRRVLVMRKDLRV